MTSSSSLDSSYILVGDDGSKPILRDNLPRPIPNAGHPSTLPSYTPGSSTSYAHDWSSNGTGGNIQISGRHFVDKYGRVCSLRGVNLSGASKTPINDSNDNFPAEAETANFVGRPFPLEEAHEHFSRLRRWGFTFIRFLVTWEAVEHAGPGIYDKDYLNYIRELLKLLPKYGMVAFVALHQDVWSRYSGGSGAPAWTLEKVGFDLHELVETGGAWLNGVKGGGHTDEEQGLWSTGYQKLVASTMATLFWGGDAFAPKLKIRDHHGKDVTAQQFLQSTFLDMFEQIVKAVGDLEGVIGFEMMNEPHRGYIDLKSLYSFDYNTDLHLGHIPSALQSFQLGSGHPTTVDFWKRSFPLPTSKSHKVTLNPDGRKVWNPKGPSEGQCIWEMHGVWGWSTNKDEAVVLRENYFVKHPMTGEKVDWYTDFFYPFLGKWTERVRSVSGAKEKMVFVEAIPNEFCPASFTEPHVPTNMVYAPHWYDLHALFGKAFGDFSVNVQGLSKGMFPLKAFYWGHKGCRDNYALQIRNIVESGYRVLGEKPVVIGECGVPMDMNKGEAFETEDFKWQARMMDAMITALERSLVGFTLWNYNPHNNDSLGDHWNGENFSWFSRGRALPPSLLDYHQSSPTLDNGGRILPVVVRPYPAKVAGIPLRWEWEVTKGMFVFEWSEPEIDGKGKASASVERPPLSLPGVELKARETEIYIPHFLTSGRQIYLSGLGPEDRWVHDEERQTLFVVVSDKNRKPGKRHRIEVAIAPNPYPPHRLFFINNFWGDWGGTVGGVVLALSLLVAIVVAMIFG